MKETIRQLIQHVCGQDEFNEDAAFNGLEQAVNYDWQKRFVTLLGRLSTDVDTHE